MAQAISLISGSPLIGSPIVYRVVPAAYNQNRTFHRIIVRVYAKLETDDDYTTFDFSTPVEAKTVNGAGRTRRAWRYRGRTLFGLAVPSGRRASAALAMAMADGCRHEWVSE